MIDPLTAYRVAWDALNLLLIIYIMLVAPFSICFGIAYEWHDPLGVMDLLIDTCFSVDICLSLRTGIIGGLMIAWLAGWLA